jgi:hypothetical protein
MNTTGCRRLHEDLVGLLEGTASASLRDHLAICDACRDGAHALERLLDRIGKAGDDFVVLPPFGGRIPAIAAEASAAQKNEGDRVSETRLRGSTGAPVVPRAEPAQKKSGRPLWLLLAACVSITASALVGIAIADHQRSLAVVATRSWHGKVAKIAKSGGHASTPGLTVTTPSGKLPLGEGAEIKAGMQIATDGRTRARIELDDGSTLVLDRATALAIESEPRTITIADGAVLADVAHVEKAPSARVRTGNVEVKILGTKLAVTAAMDRTNVEVLRGEVEVASGGETQKVAAGQEGVVGKDGKIDVAPANDLAQRAAFGEQLLATHNEDAEAPASGLGELRAKRPGRTDEKDHAVRMARHAVRIRIAGNVARTEIDETFANDTDEELEGIYRFPLPSGAQIERLALEVEGKLVEGEFVDKAKAAAIWRGAIQNAAPKAPNPREEIVWVPGPWHDPALLEWQRGGRFELRIFPIPKRGSRRVVIAYTEVVAPVAGTRRYVYPLPQGSSSTITIDQFSIDAQIIGHHDTTPVRVRGYELERKREAGIERLHATMSAFVPSGDLAIEYSLEDRAMDATAWAYRAPASAAEPASAEKPKSKDRDPIGDDPFVAIALRPKLPRWSETKPRDQVIVVDAGRAMFGERFARARRLAAQITQEMDRRDRVIVLACDVSCRAMPGGFVAPGAPSAHDVDAFLQGITPDGASDLVGAVRAATNVAGHEPGRDLRIAVLSDGVATAGYRSPGRVVAEVADAVTDARSLVVTVPIGADADVNLLADIARGGGGVVVPYQPGQRLEATALEVLAATYGTTLRDVEVVLPEGLRDMAPSVVAPLRAGSETIVTARMSADEVKGELVLRGKVGGDPFEAKYPLEIRATTDAGNAFVPRLFAAARIADREREPGSGSNAELVALSRRFSVPSRATSLLVLESEAMFKAFGIERAEHAPQWTGESLAQGFASQLVGGAPSVAAPHEDDLLGADLAQAEAEKKDAPLADALSRRAAAPAATMVPPAPRRLAGSGGERAPRLERERLPPRPPAGGRFMKKVFVRRATLSADTSPAVAADKVAQARAGVAAAPDERSKHKELARLLAISGQLDELGDTLEKWSSRDPLDVEVIVGRADVAARKGDRDGALRILGGALAASALAPAEAFTIAQAVGRSYDRLGRAEACAFHVAAAELRSTDADAVARAVACERAQGRARAAERWLADVKDTQRSAVSAGLAKIEAAKAEPTTGDIVVSARWSGDVDLDVVLVDPAGRRAGVVTRMKSARVEGATARDHETLALATSDAGRFVVEMVRASATEGNVPVNGTVTIKAFGQSQTIPFTLTGTRVVVGRVDVRWEQELVPIDDGPFVPLPPPGGPGPFDRGAAASALASINVRHCEVSGQSGTGHVTVTFAPSGLVSDVVVDDSDFRGTPAGRCVQTAFFGARVPPFSGASVRVGKSFTLQERGR